MFYCLIRCALLLIDFYVNHLESFISSTEIKKIEVVGRELHR